MVGIIFHSATRSYSRSQSASGGAKGARLDRLHCWDTLGCTQCTNPDTRCWFATQLVEWLGIAKCYCTDTINLVAKTSDQSVLTGMLTDGCRADFLTRRGKT